MGEEERKKRMVVESLGWLTESSIRPKKHRAISGVRASSIIELKAQLYRSQEESKKSRELAGPEVEEVHEEANLAREKASDIKWRRQEQVAAHREKLKQAYLQKKLVQMKAAANGSESQNKLT